MIDLFSSKYQGWIEPNICFQVPTIGCISCKKKGTKGKKKSSNVQIGPKLWRVLPMIKNRYLQR